MSTINKLDISSKTSLIIPVYNESDQIKNFFINLNNCDFKIIDEIIFVDDCSTDNSQAIIKKEIELFDKKSFEINFLLTSNLKNRGYGFSIKKGVGHSKNNTIAIIDLDGTYKVEDLNNIARQYVQKYNYRYDLIIGERKIDTANTPQLKIFGKSIINFITNFCFNEKIIDYNSGLRIFDKKKFNKHQHMLSDRFSLTTSMTITFLNEKYDIGFCKISYDKRSGESKLKFPDFFKFLYTIFSLLFYYKPFKTLMPLILPLFALFIYSLINDFRLNNITDKTTLLFNLNFLIVILLFVIDRINKLK